MLRFFLVAEADSLIYPRRSGKNFGFAFAASPLRLFETINNPSDNVNVMFVGDFNSKLDAFGCAKKNISGPMLKNIQSRLIFFTFLHLLIIIPQNNLQ